jgi:hypothetical protein
MKTLVDLVLGLFGAIFFLGFFVFNLDFIPMQSHCHLNGISLHDALVLMDTRRSHFLLPDGRLRVEIGSKSIQQRDAEKIAQLFPDPVQHQQVLEWGRKLIELCRAKNLAYLDHPVYLGNGKQDKTLSGSTVTAAAGMQTNGLRKLELTDELAAHAAWRRLTCAAGANEADLFRLKEVVDRAIPDESQRTELLAWAKYRLQQKQAPRRFDETDCLFRPAPPDNEWFQRWTLYEDWCVTEEMYQARKQWFITLFGGQPTNLGHDRYEALIDYGRDIMADRNRSSEGKLPLGDDRAAVIAGLDRLCGIDPTTSSKLAKFRERYLISSYMAVQNSGYGGAILDDLYKSFGLCYPNDDIYLSDLASTYGRGDAALTGGMAYAFEPYALTDIRSKETRELDDPFAPPELGNFIRVPTGLIIGAPLMLLMAFLIGRGARVVSVSVPGFLLGLWWNDKFREMHQIMKREEGYALAAMLFATVVAWLLYLRSPDPLAIVWANGIGSVFVALLAAGIFSGFVWEAIKNLIAVVMIRIGMDPEKSWIDDVLALALTAPMLFFFQNSFPSIFLGAAIGIFSPWTIEKLKGVVHPR